MLAVALPALAAAGGGVASCTRPDCGSPHPHAQAKAAGARAPRPTRSKTLRREVSHRREAGALEAAQALSKQLIDDHKRESAEAQERVQQVNTALVKQVDDITKAVAALNTQIDEKGRVLDKVWRSLTSPGGSGQIAEIGLANTLKGFGLEAGRDFELQTTTADEVSGRRLRPDALVFLPGNSALVIDCKASKYLLEIAEAESGKDEEAAYANLARTMNGHLKALDDKDYRGAVLAAWRAAGRSAELSRVLSIMYLPNEAVLEKLARADASFFARARAAEIIPAGPAGLYCALSLAAVEITKERQVENQQRIVEGAQNLIEAVAIALGLAAGVGKGIKAAAESYEKFTRSVNQRLLAAREAAVQPWAYRRASRCRANLPAYTVMSQEGDQLIEGEAAEVAEEPPAPRLLAE